MDWRSIPSLVTLRKTIDALIEEHVEPGNPEDSVTYEYIKSLIKDKNHHPNQINNAIDQSPVWTKLGAIRLKSDIVIVNSSSEDDMMCFGCGEYIKSGYSWVTTLTGVRLKSGGKCEYNIRHDCTTF